MEGQLVGNVMVFIPGNPKGNRTQTKETCIISFKLLFEGREVAEIIVYNLL